MQDYRVRYPKQTIKTDPNFPQGKARNITNPGDGLGFPWEASAINDLILARAQALMKAAGLTPNGVIDNATDSQFVEALKIVARPPPRFGQYEVTASNRIVGQSFTIANPISEDHGQEVIWPQGSDTQYVKFDEPGIYGVELTASVRNAWVSPSAVIVEFMLGETKVGHLESQKYSSFSTARRPIVGDFTIQVSDPSELLWLRVGTGTPGGVSTDFPGTLLIEQIGRGL